jgi:hypothetical protein
MHGLVYKARSVVEVSRCDEPSKHYVIFVICDGQAVVVGISRISRIPGYLASTRPLSIRWLTLLKVVALFRSK